MCSCYHTSLYCCRKQVEKALCISLWALIHTLAVGLGQSLYEVLDCLTDVKTLHSLLHLHALSISSIHNLDHQCRGFGRNWASTELGKHRTAGKEIEKHLEVEAARRIEKLGVWNWVVERLRLSSHGAWSWRIGERDTKTWVEGSWIWIMNHGRILELAGQGGRPWKAVSRKSDQKRYENSKCSEKFGFGQARNLEKQRESLKRAYVTKRLPFSLVFGM